MIIGLTGLPGCGKDTAAQMLMLYGGYQPIGFSDSLKYCVADLFDYDYEMLQATTMEQRDIRSTIDYRYGKTPVKILEEVGLKMREVYPMIFVDNTLNSLTGENPVVITDLRYPNEAEAIRARGGQVWRITRGPNPDWVENLRASQTMSYHEIINPRSDFLWDVVSQEYIHEAQWRMACSDMYFDVEIKNDGTLEEFEETLKGLATIGQ